MDEDDDRNEQANQIIIEALLDIKAQLDQLEAKLNKIEQALNGD